MDYTKFLKPNIQLFAEKAPKEETNKTDENNESPGVNQNGDKTYTQEELDKIVNERTGRATKSALSSFFKQKGLSEQEATQAINTYLADKEKQKPDMGKIQSDLQSALSARAAAEVNQAATLEAVKQGVDVNSVPYILKLADFTDVMNSDGKVDGDKLTQAVKKVLDDVPAFKTPTKDENSGVKKIGGDGSQTPPENVTKGNVPSKKWNKFNI